MLRYVETHNMKESIEAPAQGAGGGQQAESGRLSGELRRQTLDLVASFQRAMVEDLVSKTLAAARAYEVATLFVTGGVAANQELRADASSATQRRKECRSFSRHVRSRPTMPP